MSNDVDNSRRKFIAAGVAGTAGLVLAPGVTLLDMANARPAGEAVSSTKRWGMLIDSTKCASGCTDCVTACNKENGLLGGHPEPTRSGSARSSSRKSAPARPIPCR